MTEMKVKKADAVPKMARVLNVRGSDAKKDTTATMALKPIVQRPWPVMVFKYLAPVRQCRPWMKVLFRMNMKAVAHHAHLWPQKSI